MHKRSPSKAVLAFSLLAVTAALVSACTKHHAAVGTKATPLERGAYLVTVGGCHDCHSPKVFTATGPELDKSRLLSGHPAQETLAPIPVGAIAPNKWGAITNNHLTAWAGPWGVSFTANLTPDPTGLSNWKFEDFARALRTGKHLGVGRPILPPMPWFNYGLMSDDDLLAVFTYLQSLPPVSNQVPQPIPPAAN